MKIISYQKAKEIVESLKKQDKKTIFKSGCFDTLHIGHVKMLRNARSLANKLIVGVGTDKNIESYKRKTLFDQNNRAELLAELSCVDYVVILDEPMINSIDHKEFLNMVKPDYYYLPTDDKVLKEKKIMAEQTGVHVIMDKNVIVKNHSNIIEPHSSDILNIKLHHMKIEELYSEDFKLLKEKGKLVDDWANVYEHCKMEGNIAMIIARILDLSEEDTSSLIRAAILHDWYKRNERESQNYDSNYSRVELTKLGIDENIINIAHSVGHTSLNTIMDSDFLCKIMHFIDDITYGSEILEIDNRVHLTESSGRYTKLIEDCRKDFNGRSFFDVQKEIGNEIQAEIEKKANLKANNLIPIIKEKYKKII